MDLIVLLSLAIDVILGMEWMSDYGVLIDTSTRTIMLREPKGGNAFLVPLPRGFDLQNLSRAIMPLPIMIFQWFVSFLIYF